MHKNYKKVTIKGFIYANLIATAILLVIFKLLLPSTLAFFGESEVFFVNTIGLPFNSGTIIAALIIITIFYYGLKLTREKTASGFNYFLESGEEELIVNRSLKAIMNLLFSPLVDFCQVFLPIIQRDISCKSTLGIISLFIISYILI